MRYKEARDRKSLDLGIVEDMISAEHYIRLLDEFVERSVESDEAQYSIKGQSKRGQKPYGARTMLKLYIYGYLNRVSSSRRLEVETQRNIEMIWLLGGLQPDFKTIADYRKDHGESIRKLLKDFNRFLKQNSYIEGKSTSIDGTRLKANTRRGASSIESIEKRLGILDKELNKYLVKLEMNDNLESTLDNIVQLREEERAAIEKISELQEQIEDLIKKKEYIEADSKNRVSFADPEAPLSHSRDGCMPIHNMQSVVCDKYKMIMCSQAIATANDRTNLKPMIDQVEEEYGERPEIARADSDYFNIADIQQIQSQGTECYVNIPKSAQRKPKMDDQGKPITFTYEEERDQIVCSMGRPLVRARYEANKGGRGATRYIGKNCHDCPIKACCTTSSKGRSYYRYDDEEWKEEYIRKMKGSNGRKHTALRRAYVEHPFGTIKVVMMDRLQVKLRGTYKVQTEVCLYHFAYNFKRLLNITPFELIMKKIREFDFKPA